MTANNLWGELPDGEGIRTPYSILKEQITFLEQGTKGLLTGSIARQSSSNQTTLILQIIAPALNNYSFEVTTIKHEMSLYPLDIANHARGVWTRCADEQAFMTNLEEILKSPRVKNVISGLLAQIKAESV